jgi:hypothetical protein
VIHIYVYEKISFVQRSIQSLLALALPIITFAAPSAGATEAAKFVDKFNTIILFPTIALLSAVALLVFLWGVAEYL